MNTEPCLPLSSRRDFVALPTDVVTPLTPTQRAALWSGDIGGVLLTIARGLTESFAPSQQEESEKAS